MIIFRMIDFVFRVFATICLVLVLQIPIGEHTIEQHILSFIRQSKSIQSIQSHAQSGINQIRSDAMDVIKKNIPSSVKQRELASNVNTSPRESLASYLRLLANTLSSADHKKAVSRPMGVESLEIESKEQNKNPNLNSSKSTNNSKEIEDNSPS